MQHTSLTAVSASQLRTDLSLESRAGPREKVRQGGGGEGRKRNMRWAGCLSALKSHWEGGETEGELCGEGGQGVSAHREERQ